MRIDKLNNSDLLYDIEHIERECFHTPWSYEMLHSSYDNGCIFVTAMDGERVIGYGGFYLTGDITNIAVISEYRGQGIGCSILTEMIRLAKEYGLDSLFLEVRQSNGAAIRLYEKCGFTYIHTRQRYYENGEDALIYSLEV